MSPCIRDGGMKRSKAIEFCASTDTQSCRLAEGAPGGRHAGRMSHVSRPVAEAYVGGGQQDPQSGSTGVQRGPGLPVLQLQVHTEQQHAQELLDLVNGEEPSGTPGGPGAERHEVIPEPLAVFVEVSLLHAVLQKAAGSERLKQEKKIS